MPVELNIQNDFATILDGVEPITLKRCGSADTVAVPKAWRYSSLAQQAEPGMPGVAQSDVVWQFGWDEAVAPPRIGDSIIDGANECWTILSVEVRGAMSRLRCLARNLQIVHQLDDRIEIQEAVWADSGSGSEIVGWTTLRAAVPARIQPERTTIDNTAAPPTSTSTYRVMLADESALDHNHRLVGPDGSIYQLIEYTQAERIDMLPIATVVKLPAVS
jgi:hypothetical protein